MESVNVDESDTVNNVDSLASKDDVLEESKQPNDKPVQSIELTKEISINKDKASKDADTTDITEVMEINTIEDECSTNDITSMEVDTEESIENPNEIVTNTDDSNVITQENSGSEVIVGSDNTNKNEDQPCTQNTNKDIEINSQSTSVIIENQKSNTDKHASTREDQQSSKNNNKSCDISEEDSNSLGEDVSKKQTDPTNDDRKKSEEDGNLKKLQEESAEVVKCNDVEMIDEIEKVTGSEKSSEVEKTEFVQFNQEKDDNQIDNQSEAIDPFGGDNLNIPSDTVESMEVDSATSDKSSKNIDKTETPKDNDDSKEKEKEVKSIDIPNETEVQSNKERESSKETTKKSAEEMVSEESLNKKDAESTTDITLLPGQDVELCIIPDSTKEKSSEKEDLKKNENTEKAKEKDDILIDNELNKTETINKDEDKEKSEKETSTSETTEKVNENTGLKVAALTVGTTDIQVNVEKSPDGPSIVTSDIIDIDDDPKVSEIEEISAKEICKQCKLEKSCTIKVRVGTKQFSVCSEACKSAFANDNNKATDIPSDGVNSKREKRCANCLLIVESKDERNLSWETMEFCNEECLGKFQTKYGSYCRNCNGAVQPVSLGKYCVRFGYDVRQFCCSTCLEEFKKGLKVCSYCQKDISAGTEGFLAPVGDKGQFKDFCTQDCMEKYSKMNSTEPPVPEKKVCGVCQEEKVMHCEVQIERNPSVPICSEPCFAAFKFVNKVDPDQCSTCKKYFQLPTKKGFIVFYEDEAHTFCNKTCLNVFIITNRKIVPCNWCKVKKYNFDMIKKELKTGQVMMMCSLNCLTLYQVSINAVSARRIHCDFCKEYSQAQYHLTMSDATIRNFCSYKCVMNFQAQYTKSPITIPTSDTNNAVVSDPVPTGNPKRAIAPSQFSRIQPGPSPDLTPTQLVAKKTMPVISSVTSLAIANGQAQNTMQLSNALPSALPAAQSNIAPTIPPLTIQNQPSVIYKQQIVMRPPSPVEISNKMTQCRPQMHTKGVSVRPIPKDQSTQTEAPEKVVLPVPLPFCVPVPVHMYHMPFPVPVPIPIPIPVPIFIPTTRNSIKGIAKELKRIQEKIPSDPFEAELLMMAEMVATDKKNESDSDSNDEARDGDGAQGDSYSPEGVDSSNTFNDDMLQMALKMATGELEEPPVDLDAALTPSTIQTSQRPENDEPSENDAQPERLHSGRGRKRGSSFKTRSIPSKRGRRAVSGNDIGMLTSTENQASTLNKFIEPTERPDANMALKYTYGINAWRQWVITKNAELEKQSTPTRKLKLFKTDLLQLTADELNYSLCLFVKELRKPNGAEYEPDTIFYLCLGIQQYLFENNRIDNIFTDAYYEKFTDCLNEVAKKFASLYNNAFRVITRVEEEHLWECKQLGAHSPHVLLNTLMYFNTKHFNLVSVEEHMQLSFSHIMKHWKRNSSTQAGTGGGKVPGSRNVLLRFYPPQAALEANSKKKKVYEQQENESNPLRCPVKLYEFYLSKCPESVKTRNDVFYLLPERSCVPDSPVWYSTSPLAKEHLIKMLYRIKMVKEINVALLSS